MELPLISCIMPTKNRRAFVARSLRSFAEQDYPHKELIVVDDGDDLVVDLASRYAHVRYLAPQYAHTVGAKRNIACEAARGEIICHWDDDDWYSPSRLSYQVKPMLAGKADITGLHLRVVLDIQRMQGWQCADSSAVLPGVDGMHYGTMLYRKQLWMNQARFQDSPRGDDGSGFVRRLINLGASVCTLPCAGHHIYVRHGRNIWKYRPGERIGTETWERVALEACVPAEEWLFYKDMHVRLTQRKPFSEKVAPLQKRMRRAFVKRL